MKKLIRTAIIIFIWSALGVVPTPASAQCTGVVPNNPCSPGGGSKTTDCQMEWRFTPMPNRLVNGTPTPDMFRGRPRNRIICYEGDPRCDFDPNLLNNSCTMKTEIFINNQDPNLGTCNSASGIAVFEVKRPNPSSASLDAADNANLQTLENQAGSGGFGVTVVRKRTPVQPGNPNTTQNLGSPPLDLVVPQKQRSDLSYTTGTKRIRIQSSNQLEKRDPDSLLLLCRVSTCGNSIVETDHETCDDGNRNNGDGCNQACQIEVVVGTPTNTPTITDTPTVTNTPQQTATRTPTSSPTNSNTPQNTATQTATNTPQNTGSVTPTSTPTRTFTQTNTPANTATITNTATVTHTPTITNTPAHTPTPTNTSAVAPTPLNVILAPGGGSTNSCRGTCAGGSNAGNPCVINPNCPGSTCTSKKCVGGPYNTQNCANALDCNGCDPNQVCTGAGAPLACCSGVNAGTCPVAGSCALVQNILFAVRVPLNGICTPRTIPDTSCVTNVECTGGATCVLSKLGITTGAPDGNGEAPITIPASSVALNPAVVSGIGTVCVGFAADGVGVHDCDGGRADRDLGVSIDHNTSPNGCLGGPNNGMACTSNADCPAGTFETCAGTCTTGTNVGMACTTNNDCPSFPFDCNSNNSGTANGLPDDPQCDDTFTAPNGSISYACREGDMQCNGGINDGMICTGPGDCPGAACTLCNSAGTHPDICNSPNHAVLSGTFGSGDIVIAAPLTLTILPGAANYGPDNMPCTIDDAPPSPPAPVQVTLGTGIQQVTVFDASNSFNSKIGPGLICGSQPCAVSITGQGISCATLGGGSVTGLKLSGGFPALDTTAGDIGTVFQFTAQ